MQDPVIVQAAINASVDAEHRAGTVPLGDDALVYDALAAWDAGAAMVGLHVCEPGSAPADRPRRFARIAERVRAEGCDAVLALTCFSCGGPAPHGEADGGYGIAGPRPGAAVVDCAAAGRLSPANGGRDRRVREAAAALRKAGIAPQFKCYEPSDVRTALRLRDEGLVAGRVQLQLVVAAQLGEEARIERVMALRALVPPSAMWSVRGDGAGRLSLDVLSLVTGGHIVTGLEDSAWLVEDVPATNTELVERVVRIVDELDRPLATPDEAREILMGDGIEPDRRSRQALLAGSVPIDLRSVRG